MNCVLNGHKVFNDLNDLSDFKDFKERITAPNMAEKPVFHCKDKKINPKTTKKCGKIWSIEKRALTLHSQKAPTPLRQGWTVAKGGPFVYRLGREIFIL